MATLPSQFAASTTNETVRPLFDPSYDPGQPAIVGFMSTFMGIRSKMNEQAMAIRLKQFDPEYLYKMKLALMDERTKIETAKAELIRQTGAARADAVKSMFSAMGQIYSANVGAQAEVQGVQQRERQSLREDKTKRDAMLIVDPKITDSVTQTVAIHGLSQSTNPKVVAAEVRNILNATGSGTLPSLSAAAQAVDIMEQKADEVRAKNPEAAQAIDVLKAGFIQEYGVGGDPREALRALKEEQPERFGVNTQTPGEVFGEVAPGSGSPAGLLYRLIPDADTAGMDKTLGQIDAEMKALDEKIANARSMGPSEIFASLGNLSTSTPNKRMPARIERRAGLIAGMPDTQREMMLNELGQHSGPGAVDRTISGLQEDFGGLPPGTTYRQNRTASDPMFSQTNPGGEGLLMARLKAATQLAESGDYSELDGVAAQLQQFVNENPHREGSGDFVREALQAYQSAKKTNNAGLLARNWSATIEKYKNRPPPAAEDRMPRWADVKERDGEIVTVHSPEPKPSLPARTMSEGQAAARQSATEVQDRVQSNQKAEVWDGQPVERPTTPEDAIIWQSATPVIQRDTAERDALYIAYKQSGLPLSEFQKLYGVDAEGQLYRKPQPQVAQAVKTE